MVLMEFNSQDSKAKPWRSKAPGGRGISRTPLASAVRPPAGCCPVPAVFAVLCLLCERIPKPLSSLGNLLTDHIEDDSYKSNNA